MAVGYNPRIVTDGLLLALDAGNTKSYDNPTITYVGGTSDSDNSSSFTLSGLQSGDLVLYFSAEDGVNVNTPTGASWTAIPGLTTQPDNDNDPNSAAFYVFATGTSVTASGLATGNNHVRVMIAFRNVNSTNPFDVNATENSGNGLPDPPSITPVTDNSMIVAVGLLDDHDIANSISPPTGYTTAVNMDSQGGANDTGLGGATIMTAYKLLATAAAEDPSGFTGTTGDPQKGISIALRQATSLIWTDLSGNGNDFTIDASGFTHNSSGYFEMTTGGIIRSSSITSSTDCTCIFFIRTTDTQSVFLQGHSGTTYLGAYRDNNKYYNSQVGSPTLFMDTSSIANLYDNIRDDQWHMIEFKGANLSSWTSIQFNKYPGYIFDNGDIGQIMIYNRNLTESESQQNYNALKGRYGI